MIPYRDLNRTRRTPWVVIALIAINAAAFLWTWGAFISGDETWLMGLAFTPGRATLPAAALGSMVTAQFLHAGWFHLGSNMIYLWVFGDNVEEALGRFRFLGFYLVCGVAAMAAEALLHTTQPGVPIIGASGAVSGVLGAYLLLYPRARILVLVPVFVFLRTFVLPAWLMLGYWVLLQGLGAHFSRLHTAGGGVAYFAHLGGFVSGIFLCWLLKPKKV